VVASGCTDSTVEIARSFTGVQVLVQEAREGKASAINLFLRRATGDYLVLESADTIPLPGAIEALVAPLEDERVGAVTGRPKPLNNSDTMVGFAVNLLWDLHHLFSLQRPKLSEAVAFKNVFKLIPRYTKVDDACIETAVRSQGYQIVYEPNAVFINKGPQTVADFVQQRRRISLGFRYLRSDLGFSPATTKTLTTLRMLVKTGYLWRSPVGTVVAMGLEAWSRVLAGTDHRKGVGKDDGSWGMIKSSKELVNTVNTVNTR
jgi:cellulose synthase/poly-beta-1,6-N-acetylglucosamine synthase-like glycosyltransferase